MGKNQVLHKAIDQVLKEIVRNERLLGELRFVCKHEVVRGGIIPHKPEFRMHELVGEVETKPSSESLHTYESGNCWICGKDFGWYCPDSPDHICEEENLGTIEKPWYSEYCKYCHQPEERK